MELFLTKPLPLKQLLGKAHTNGPKFIFFCLNDGYRVLLSNCTFFFFFLEHAIFFTELILFRKCVHG